MAIDSAFILFLQTINGEEIEADLRIKALGNSVLVSKLLEPFNYSIVNGIWRLHQLSYIPSAGSLPQVNDLVLKVMGDSFTGNGFSINGRDSHILPCYNALFTTALIRLGYGTSPQVEKAVEWILQYQQVGRNEVTTWKGEGILKYGGCLKSVPCYHGLVKALITLTDFQAFNVNKLPVKEKLDAGLTYVKSHFLFKRQSNYELITKDITDLVFPYTYKTNLIELLELMYLNGQQYDTVCKPAKRLLLEKLKTNGYFKTDHKNLPKVWVNFDNKNSQSYWASAFVNRLLA